MVMEASYRKMGGKRSPETLCISNIPQIVSSIQHSVFIMDDTLSQISENHKFIAGQDNYMCKNLAF